MRTQVSVKGLHDYLTNHVTDEQYAEAPILDSLPTRRLALKYLRELANSGTRWLY